MRGSEDRKWEIVPQFCNSGGGDIEREARYQSTENLHGCLDACVRDKLQKVVESETDEAKYEENQTNTCRKVTDKPLP